MDIEEQINDPVEDSIRGDLERAFAEAENPVEPEIKAEKTRDETGKFAKKTDEPEVKLEAEKVPEPPRSWNATEKSEWSTMTPAQRSAVMRRESEVELGFTKLDEDRNFGKSLKEVIAPYLSIITAEGGTPATAVKELLNTAYILRTAPAAQKTALFHQLAQQYGVDLKSDISTVQPDQTVQQLQNQVLQLRQEIQKQPEVFEQQQANRSLKGTIDAFAADPKNIHYEKLKPVMASLLQNDRAKDMQDAYEQASWADPDIRPALVAEQAKSLETQRINDIKAKTELSRKAAVSVRGSPSINPVPNGKSNGSIADDLREAWDLHA